MYDYHTHSSFSDDCNVPMTSMIVSAIQKCIKEMAVTDHYDPDYPDTELPFLIDMDNYHTALLSASDHYKGQIKILKGIEIGIQHGSTIDKCEKAASGFPYDFIIGSFHCANGYDLYKYDYSKIGTEDVVMSFYEYMYDCLTHFKNYDIIGHFNIIDRYTPYVPDYAPYRDIIAEILKVMINDGKGIELNTSSFRYGMGERTTASKEILLLYQDLCRAKPSFEPIITFGSDAHRESDIAYQYVEAIEYLKSLGFDKLATFENREAKLIGI